MGLEVSADQLFQLANCVRAPSIDAVEKASSGRPGAPTGVADAAAALFANHPNLDASLRLTGLAVMTLDEIKSFRQWGSRTAGHPGYGRAARIDTTTGPLGQGLTSTVGMAIAERILAESFGSRPLERRTDVLFGDGCQQEGETEAIGTDGFGASASADPLFERFGITTQAVVDRTAALVASRADA